jgi:predicted ATPase
MLVHEITLRNLLSFGPETPTLPLHDLNVLIGPNGSGKSNLIEAIGLLRAAPSHLASPVRDGGGVRDWLWKGTRGAVASIDVVVDDPKGRQPLRHVIEFAESAQKFELIDERIENQKPYPGHEEAYFFYKFQQGRPVLSVSEHDRRELRREDVSSDESILSQRKDPDQYPEITHLGRFTAVFASIGSGHLAATPLCASRRRPTSPTSCWTPTARTWDSC